MRVEDDGNVATYWQVADFPFCTLWFEEDAQWYKVRDWCIEYDGVGRFYTDLMFGQFYFECEEDRVMFLLRWGSE